MAITAQELGRRLKVARESVGLTQEEAATHVEVTRASVTQIEAGMRAPNSLHLVRLAELYRREVGDLLAQDFDEAKRDALAVLFRADAQIANDPVRAQAVQEYARLCREYTNLESLLNLNKDHLFPVAYDVPLPGNRWEAIRQGERVAELERARLKLGDGPIRNVEDVLEAQGLRVAELSLPENISGFFLNDARFGLSIVVNVNHHPRRRAFSYAHEYCHVLADRDRTSLVSKSENREDLPEVRANAFSAAFLMPEEGVSELVRAMGKGELSRSVLQAFDEGKAVSGQRRVPAFSQDFQLYDVIHLAHHFCVSYEMTLYRLLNLKLISDEQQKQLAEQRDLANTIRDRLWPESEGAGQRSEFRHRLFFLALEAYRREAISRRKVKELATLAQLAGDELEELLAPIDRQPEGLKERSVHIPKG